MLSLPRRGQLVAPDVEPDIYPPVDDEDDDWVSFLRGFSAPPPATDAQEEEEDEEYVFQVSLQHRMMRVLKRTCSRPVPLQPVITRGWECRHYVMDLLV